MLNNTLKIIYFIFICLFFYFVIYTYFSNTNIDKSYNRVLKKQENLKKEIGKIPLLQNDTENIIIYDSEKIIEKKIKKRKIWELLQ